MATERAVLAALAAALLPAAPARAEQLPRWEVGLGLTALHLPDYNGADEGRGYLLPFPLIIYRGERLRSDREGVRAELFESDRIRLNLSFGGSLPVRVDRNEARAGMPALAPVVELGPSLAVSLARWSEARSELQLRLPVRAAFALEGGIDTLGAVFNPHLRFSQRRASWALKTDVAINSGPSFSSRGMHAYFYDVAPEYTLPARPAYEAPGGYSGWVTWASATKPVGRWRWFAYGSAYHVANAAYADSPLVRRDATYTVSVGVGYVFAQSVTRVENDD